MRLFMKLLLVAAFGWSGYWFIGSNGQKKLFENWLETNRSNGWVATSEDMRVTGFPNRFDTIITALDLQGPAGNWGWQADVLQVLALSYKLNHIIVSLPGQQVISNAYGSLTLQGTKMRGSVEMTANARLTLERLRAEATDLTALGSLGWQGQAESLNLALYQDAEINTRYRLGLDFINVQIPSEFMAAMTRIGQDSDLISKILLSANIDFEDEINRNSLNTGLPRWTGVDIETVEINWGDANLTMSGNLFPARNGYVDGELVFKVENWRILFDAYSQITTATAAELAVFESALNGASDGDTLDFTLRYSNGKAKIGLFTIGGAPVNPFF